MESRAYLDTHILIWLHDQEFHKLSGTAVDLIESHELFCSEFVRLELKYLEEIERLRIAPDEIIRFLVDEIHLKMCTEDLGPIITEAFALSWTRDPFDRLITANASLGNHLLISKDRDILTNYRYARF